MAGTPKWNAAIINVCSSQMLLFTPAFPNMTSQNVQHWTNVSSLSSPEKRPYTTLIYISTAGTTTKLGTFGGTLHFHCREGQNWVPRSLFDPQKNLYSGGSTFPKCWYFWESTLNVWVEATRFNLSMLGVLLLLLIPSMERLLDQN